MDKVLTVCDLHGDADVRAEVSVRIVGLGPDRSLDLCGEHRDAFDTLPPARPSTAGAAAVQTSARRREAPTRPRTTASKAAAGPSDRPSGPRSGKKADSATAPAPAAAGTHPGSRRSLQQERALVREWARQQGRDIGDKGRLPSGLVEEYRRTQGTAVG